MSAHTRKHHIDNRSGDQGDKSVFWRDAAKELFDEYSEAGVMIRGYRCKEGYTQAVLAKKLGMKQHHVSEMERGKRPVSKKTAHKLGEIFGVSYKLFL